MTVNQKDNIELRNKIIVHLQQRLHNCELSARDQKAILEGIGIYGNLMTLSDYGRKEGLSYNGVLDRIKSGKIELVVLFNSKFVIDNA